MEINAFIARLFDRAKAAGLEKCEVYYTSGDEFETEVFRGEIVSYKVSDFKGLSFRALVNGRMGYAATQVLDEEAVDMLVDGVQTNLTLLEDEDEQFLFAGGGEYQPIDGYNGEIERLSAREKIDMTLAMEKAALAVDPRVEQVSDCMTFTSSEEKRIVNTLGLDVSHRANMIGGYVGPVAREGDQVNNAYAIFFTNDPGQIDVERTAQEAVKDAVDGLNGQPVASGKYRVVLRGDVMASILSTFDSVFSAASAQKGLSLLKGREGETIADPCVTLWDDPHMKGGLASAPFDAEGVPTRKKAVIEGGVFRTLLHNLKTAHKQGVESTGNASKSGYAAQIAVAPSNFYFAPGEKTLDQLLEQAGDGLFITNVGGLHSGADSISGDFSVSAKGFVIRDGVRCESVGQITLAGNFFELLRNARAFSDRVEFGFPSQCWMGSPAVLVEDLSVAGK